MMSQSALVLSFIVLKPARCSVMLPILSSAIVVYSLLSGRIAPGEVRGTRYEVRGPRCERRLLGNSLGPSCPGPRTLFLVPGTPCDVLSPADLIDAGLLGHLLEALALAGILALAAVHGSLAFAVTLAGVGAVTLDRHVLRVRGAEECGRGEQRGGCGCECCGNQFAIHASISSIK